MPFSVLLATFLLVLVGESIADTSRPLGTCKELTQVDKTFDFNEFATEKNGFWNGTLVPDTKFYRTVKTLWSEDIPTKEKGVYISNTYYQTGDGVIRKLVENERLKSLSPGHVTGTVKNKDGKVQTITFTVIKYVKGNFAYYYGCNSAGGDDTTDYRYVLSHGTLKPKIIAQIKKLDKKLGFKNKLIQVKA